MTLGQITTHILDTSAGRPASGVGIELAQQDGDGWATIGTGETNRDGRADPLDDGVTLPEGVYRLTFAIADYFKSRNQECFYPYVEIPFCIAGDGQHYHVPLLLNPFGYSTYRGS